MWAQDAWLQEHALKSVESAPLEDEKADSDKPRTEIKPNPRVYLDIEINGNPVGRIEILVRLLSLYSP